ncbi:LuxR C-terminal-related transcriptional regulator [Amycolatopsis sp. RTGN1]|uniref:LuxR C-terminal-related transcriptional regulator n=1 Tax=Amycolatopsis ponsaeliensis TaxID=2992142 RepID=UPI00254C0F91|nr:LuxR C-terminal-related transcriptional regulator [Amycolatopsis sp. RTGN1]
MSAQRSIRDAAASAGQLPADVTTFVGRKNELGQAKRLLSNARLLTLTGFGGVGKTRLALRLAQESRRAFPGGVRLVSLAALAEPELVASAVAEALGVRDQSARPPMDALIEHLQDRRLLLVLDNCEHLVDAVGVLIGTLLGVAPNLKIIATSRAHLNVHGEHVFVVPPLSVPDEDTLESGHAVLTEFEAIRLLVDRATAAGYPVSDDNLRDLARLCRRLDGIPLAIELAAVRLKTLSAQEILRRLSDRFRLLTGGDPRVVPSYHQTLRATVDWSYALCSHAEHTLWARLSVFAGSFDLDAAEAVCAGGGFVADDVLDLLAGLNQQSILTVDNSRSSARYTLVDTVREYGQERLDELGDTARMRQRHRVYYENLVVDASTTWYSSREIELLTLLKADLPNIRALMDRCLSEPGAEVSAITVAIALSRVRFWFFHGTIGEGRMWLRRSLEQISAGHLELRRVALACAAWLALCQGEHDDADTIRGTYRELGPGAENGFAEAVVCFAEGIRRWLVDAHPDAVALLLQARDLFLRLGAHGDAYMADLFATMAAGFLTDRDTALPASEDLLNKAEASGGIWSISWARWAAGFAELRFGNRQRATRMLRDALSQQRAIGDQWGPVWSVEALAWAAAAMGEFEYAAWLFGAADQMRKLTGAVMSGLRTFAEQRAVAERLVRSVLTPQQYSAAYRQGSLLTWDEALTLALHRRAPDPRQAASRSTSSAGATLSRRETEIAKLIAEGLSNPDIASKLVISARTVEKHVSNILTKIGLNNRQQVAAWVATPGNFPARGTT